MVAAFVIAALLLGSAPANVHAACVGDCDGDGRVKVDELVTGVNIALANLTVDACENFDADHNTRVTVDELVSGVNNALNGCPIEPTPTATATPTPTATASASPTVLAPTATLTAPPSATPTHVNQPPAFASTPITTAAVDALYTYAVVATDPDGDALIYSLNGAPDGMTIDSTTGAIAWLPLITQAGTQHPTIQVSDGHGGNATQSFRIAVTPAHANRPPTAQDDRYCVRRDQMLAVAGPGVLANDSDPDGDALAARLVAGPVKGVLDLQPGGSFNYTPSRPPPGSNEPLLKFGFTDPDGVVAYAVNQPVVVDLDKDGSPEIIFTAWNSFLQRRLIAVHGKDGSQAFSVDVYQPTAVPPLVLSQEALAAGDLDGDGFPEVVTPLTDPITGDRTQLIAFNHDGSEKWRSPSVIDHVLVDSVIGSGSGSFTKPLIANITGDANPEIVIGYVGYGPNAPLGAKFVTVFDNQGHIVWTAQGSVPSAGDGAVIAQDIDLDGNLEIVFQNDVFDHSGNLRWSATDDIGFQFAISDVAVANLDDDPFGEVVYLDIYNELYVYEHTGVRKWGPVMTVPNSYPGTTLLTVGDVDGDGTPEIVVMGDNSIAAVKPDGTVRTIPLPYSTAQPVSGRTVTIFDLNGDGKPELLYNGVVGPDDNNGTLFILDGQTGALLHSITSPRISTDGSPIIADVDGDGTAEIITPNSGFNVALRVYTAKTGAWAQARPVYNQFSYHITNVNNDGSIPAHEAINWLTPGLNNYRINVPLPQERTEDKDQFTYTANDGGLDSNIATARIDILPPNHAPTILSQPPTRAAPGVEYLYGVRAVDPDIGEVLTFSLPQSPTGMTIDAASGLIRWTPTAEQMGRQLVTAKVTDSQGQSVLQGYAIDVVPAVTVPAGAVGQTQDGAEAILTGAGLVIGSVTTTPSATVPAGHVISQEPPAGTTVPSGSPVNLVVSSGPRTVPVPDVVGQTQATAQRAITGIGLNIGRVRAVPNAIVPAGSIISQDPAGGTLVPLATAVDMLVSVGAVSLDGLTSIIVEPTAPLILVGEQQTFTATGVFNDGTSQNVTGMVGWSSTDGSVTSISPVGVASGLSDGSTNIEANVNGITGSATLTVRARVADVTPPIAEITTPTSGDEITAPIDVIGAASDANFLKYVLEYAPAGVDRFTELASGTVPVSNGKLGTLDPTLLLNDLYTLRLTVFDRDGNQASASVGVQVAREQKVGLFALAFQDLNVGLAGLPVTVTRTYDSRDKSSGDFGVGWRLGVQTIRIRANRILGSGWVRAQSGPVVSLLATDEHRVSVTLADGKIEEFDMQLSPTAGFGSLDLTSVIGFVPRAGTLGHLDALAGSDLLIVNAGAEDELVDVNTLNTYNPTLFRYTATDGTQFEIDPVDGVKRIIDLNANTLTFGPSGIVHSSGIGVAFIRDSAGRITAITDPDGQTRHYAYDLNGDLVSSTDQVGNTTRYSYNGSHGLLDIRDAQGNHAVRSEYDADGRLVATVDAQGHRIQLSHGLDTMQEVVTDRNGNVTVFEYDAVGNVVAKTDALSNRTEFTYDARGNELTEKDALGRVAVKTYDTQNNILSRTDFDGNTTTYTYNARNQVLTLTDPEGHRTANVYDANGNLVQSTDPEGGLTTHSYDASGNRLSTTDALGNVTTYAYDTFGHRSSQTDPMGHVSSFTSDAKGNVLSQTRTRTVLGGGAQTLTSLFVFDGAGRLTKVTDALGHNLLATYDPSGNGQNVATVTDAAGRVTSKDYDSRGELIQTTFADRSAKVSTYDPEGHIVSQTNRDGHVSAFDYDALGRMIKTTNPGGSTTSRSDDAVGRVLSQTDERGHALTFSYAPNQQTVTDALGNATVYTFDGRGNRIEMTDALGHTTRYEYDSKGDLKQTAFPDGSTKTATFDAMGRKITETDQAGNTTHLGYDPLGRLSRVTDAGGGITTYAYDEVGNLIQQTDANGHATKLEYDELGRLTRRIRPRGQQETFGYDATGNVISHTDFNGHTINMLYDSNDRLIRKTLPGGGAVPFAYSSEGLRTQAGGDLDLYDARGQVVQETKASTEVIAYAYDAAGNRTSVTTTQGTTTYAYDDLNRMVSVSDATGETTYTYDAVGNLASKTTPNGVTTVYTYDTLNRLTQVSNTGPGGLISSYTYTLGPAGNRLKVVEDGPATTGRTVTYAYDVLYRLTQETIDEVGTVNDVTISYTYDAVGNRRTKTTVHGTETTEVRYTYDENDRLLSETTTVAIAQSMPGSGIRYALTAYAFSPFLAGAVSLGGAWRRRNPMGRRARRRFRFRSLVALTLVATQVCVPSIAHAGLVDQFGPRAAPTQPTQSTLTYTYDNNGNTLSRSDGTHTDTYTYDAESRLIAADVQLGPNPGLVSYTYDADGMRTSRTASGVTTTYLVDKHWTAGTPASCRHHCGGGEPLPQVLVETAGSSITTYSYGLELINQTQSGVGARFYQFDGQGSTRQLVTPAGAVSDAYTYDAFGVLLASTGTTPNAYLYDGEQLDANVGFYYLRARYYNQANGRFLTTDPEEGSPFDPISLHRYLYANADPVNHADPSGRATLAEAVVSLAIEGIIVFALSTLIGRSPQEAARDAAEAVAITALLVYGLPALLAAIGAIGGATTAAALGEGAGALKLIRALASEDEIVAILNNLKKFRRLDNLPAPIRAAVREVIEQAPGAFCKAKSVLANARTFNGIPGLEGVTLTPALLKTLLETLDTIIKIAGLACP